MSTQILRTAGDQAFHLLQPVRGGLCYSQENRRARGLHSTPRMGFKSVEEIHAFQLTRAFKLECYRLIRESAEARADLRFKSQLQEALAGAESNISEGFRRWPAGEFAHFLSFAKASLEEGVRRLQDGIDRDYFREADCIRARQLGDRALRCTAALHTTERQLAEENKRKKRRPPRRPRGT